MRRLSFLLLTVAGVALCPSTLPANAQESTELEEILDAHAAAVGWPRDQALAGALYIRARVEGLALSGRAEAWAEAPLFNWSRLELGPLSLETGFDGDVAWIMDRNGAVRRAEASEEAGALMDALLIAGAYVLRSPPVPLIRRALEPDEQGRPRISMKVWGAEPQILVFDPETWQLVESIWNDGQVEMRSEYFDHREVQGIWIPHRTRLSYADQMSLDLLVEEFERTDERGKAAYTRPAPGEDGLLFHGGDSSGELPMLGDGLHIVVESTLDSDHRGRFLLDTGAGSSIIAMQRLDGLGLETTGELRALGAGGTTEAGLVEIQRLELGRLEYPPQTWMTVDLAPMGGQFADENFLGVLGYDSFNRVILEIDYDGGLVKLHRREGFIPPAEAGELALRMDGNIPTVQVEIEDIEAWLHLDTGSNGSLDLAAPFVESNGLLGDELRRGEMRDAGVNGLGGSSTARRGKLRHMKLGDFEFQDLDTNFSTSDEGIFGNTEIAGVLGAQVLSQFHLYLDYEGGRLWLIAGESYSQP